MTVTTRPAVPDDLDALVRIEQAVFGANAWSAEQVADELAHDTRWYVVAQDDAGQALGYAGLYVSVPDADVQTVVVAREAQGRGVGRRLVAELVTHAWARGCTRIFLEVRADNEAALHVYDGAGFRRLGRRPRYYPDGSDAVTMRLRRHEVPDIAAAAHE